MRTFLCIVILAILNNANIFAQLSPEEGIQLNYTLIGFRAPVSNSGDAEIFIAKGSYTSYSDFRKHIIIRQKLKDGKAIVEVPLFNSKYTWQVVENAAHQSAKNDQFFHFSTGMCSAIDTSLNRLLVAKSSPGYRESYLFLDANKAMFNMDGKPLWYLPLIDGRELPATDIKLTPQGTITFIAAHDIYEVDYNGHILWKGPDNGNVDKGYHHEFTRLSNGHYMVFGNRFANCLLNPDGSVKGISDKDFNTEKPEPLTMRLPFSNLIEYDEKGKIVWQWESKKYFMESDLLQNSPTNRMPVSDIHENSFYFDEKESVIYVGFKNINRVVKIKYPEGTVLNTYGQKYTRPMGRQSQQLFCEQHSIKKTADDCMLLINNNKCNNGLPVVEKLKEGPVGSDQLEEVWSYTCVADFQAPDGFPKGGNAIELKDHSFFISMPEPESKMFIVTPEKKTVWEAKAVVKDGEGANWRPRTQYRVNMIENKMNIERLIWSAIPVSN